MKEYTGIEVAVIGMAGRFPGAKNIRSFWQNLKNGVESISFFTDDELLASGEGPELIKDSSYVKVHGLLEDKEYFDSSFFNFIPDEARLLDPQVRLFHECVWSALEDAGVNLNADGNKAGLFAGASSNVNWELYSRLVNKGSVNEFAASQLSNSRFVASKLSYFLDLKGPVVFLDTACSTSLVAIHQACQNLLMANCNIAIAGGVSITNKAKKGYLYSEGMIYSKDGHCRSFDAKATGTVGAEGAAVVVLKSLKNALKDGDHIWAIIKGSSINNDGNGKVGYTAPSVDGQTEVIMRAQKWAKVEPESISLIEAHGTATKLGDPIEVEALNRAFGASKEKYCALGSAKSNVGHMDAAAGATGFIKAVMALKNKQIPPSLHYEAPNPAINFENTPFYVNTKLKEWKNGRYPLRAGVSSFGVGGTNAHVILEEAPEQRPTSIGRDYQLLLFSAKTLTSLQRNLQSFRDYFKDNELCGLPDIAYTLQAGRTPFAYRKAITCRSTDEAIKKLSTTNLLSKKLSPLSDNVKPQLVFMFTGAGAQFVNMYLDIYEKENFFKSEVDKCFRLAKKISGRDLKSIIYPAKPGDTDLINSIENTQPALFIMEYALARLLMKWGVKPDIMIGHSFGQYVAACISEVFSLEDALRLIIKRGEVMLKVPSGAMLSISISENGLKPYLKDRPEISLAAINSSELCVVSGTEDSIMGFKSLIDKEGYKCKVLLVSVAGHSHLMDGILDEFKNEVASVAIKEQKIPFISNLSGKNATNDEVSKPAYWTQHLRRPVKFAQGIEGIFENKHAVFIELGPANVLSTFVRSHASRAKTHQVIDLVRHPNNPDNDMEVLLNGIGQLWSAGVEFDWKSFYDGETRRKVSLPTYSFDKRKFPVNVDAQKMIADMAKGHLDMIKDPFDFSNELVTDEEHLVAFTPGENTANPTEQAVIRLWQNFFGRKDINVEDDFFKIGGDSLKAMTMIGQIKKTFNVEIKIKTFFGISSVRTLSQYISSVHDSNQGPWKNPAIKKTASKDYYQLSSSQKRLFFLHQFDKNSLAYNVSKLVKIEGDLQIDKLAEAFNGLLMRHESLRTSFGIIEGQPIQTIGESMPFEIEHHEAAIDDDNDDDDNVDAVVRDFIRPFDLTKYPLMRAGLVTIGPKAYILMLDMHHIIMDGLSENIIINDLLMLYNQQELPVLGLQYKDYAEWQQSDEQQREQLTQKEFWLNQFSEGVSAIDLPYDFSRPSIKSYEGGQISFEMGAAEVTRLKALAQKEGTTLFMVLLSAYNLLLAKLSNQEDIVVGTPVGGRNHVEFESIVGVFINTLALRNYPKGDITFRTFLSDLTSRVLECFDNQIYPYEELVNELKVTRETSRNPLFDVMFIFQDFEEPDLSIDGLSIKPYKGGQIATQVDLALSVIKKGKRLLLNYEYSTQLFKHGTVIRFAEYIKRILSSLINNIDTKLAEIEILSIQERTDILKNFNDTKKVYPKGETIISLFEKQVAKSPDAIAVVYKDQQMTFEELNRRAGQLAHHLLQSFKIRSDDPVGIMMERSGLMLVGIFGILKSGGAYVPIDPFFPKDRIYSVIQDSRLKVLITRSKHCDSPVAFNIPVVDLDQTLETTTSRPASLSEVNVKPNDLAYIIYTSGSTGKPKGVMIEHHSVVNRILWMQKEYPIKEGDVILQKTSLAFDVSVWELFWWSFTGASLNLLEPNAEKEPDKIIEAVVRHKVTTIHFVPSMLSIFLSSLRDSKTSGKLSSLRQVFSSGEALMPYHVNEFAGLLHGHHGTRLINLYGPTEATVDVTYYECLFDKKYPIVPIGKAIDNMRLYILNKEQLSPIGVSGELCIAGAGLARGYLNKKELTAGKFIMNPHVPGERIYRTGDLARWLSDGFIEFLGRIDNQVKLRGFRIELGDIECNLLNHDKISDSIVIAQGEAENKYLVAYYISTDKIESAMLKSYMEKVLPDYMVPSYFVHLSRFPLTSSGKIDRKALPGPLAVATDPYVAPSNNIEEQLVEIWEEVLKIDKGLISVNSSFFELGGHSLKAIALINKIQNYFSVEIPLQEIFNKQSVENLADYLITIKQIEEELNENNEIIEITI